MQYLGLALVVALLALVVLWVALRVLFGGSWLLGWLRGTFGMLLLVLTAMIGLIAYEVRDYQATANSTPLATVVFHAQGKQRFEVELQQANQHRSAVVEGDLWQLEVHMLRWSGLAALIGLEPGYRLQALSGRYLSVEQQEQARHTRVLLTSSTAVPVWDWLRSLDWSVPFTEPQTQRVSFMPLVDGAAFQIEQSATGLLATPVNPEARQALKDW